MEIIKLHSRYPDVKSELKLIKEDQKRLYYLFTTTSEYTRVGRTENNDIEFIDPEGGPFLSINNKVPNTNYTIENIVPIKYLGDIFTLLK